MTTTVNATILDLYNSSEGVKHLIDLFSQQYRDVTGLEFEKPTGKAFKVDADKVIAGEAEVNAENRGENWILIDTVYDNIRTLVYTSPGKKTHFYAGPVEEFNIAIARATIPYPDNQEAEDSECMLNPDFTFRQQVVGALTAKMILGVDS
jgi:hypothetical protein